jgi:hypothetical protein
MLPRIVRSRVSLYFAASAVSFRPQRDHQPGRALIAVPGRQLRDDVQLVVEVEQLVAHRRIHDAPDEAGAERGVQQVRVLRQAHPQMARRRLRLHRRRAHQGGQRKRRRK